MDAAAVPALRELAATGHQVLGRLHALWTLEGMQGLDEKTLLAALADADGKVKATAIRLCEPFLKTNVRNALEPRLPVGSGRPTSSRTRVATNS